MTQHDSNDPTNGPGNRNGPRNAHAGQRSLDTLFSCLANHRRRSVLSYLLHHEEDATTIDELVEAVVTAEDRERSGQRELVTISLHHTHLPKLAAAEYIQFDRETGTIRPTEKIEHCRPYLELSPPDESP